MKLKSTLIMIIVAIILMTGTANAGNNWGYGGRCQSREYLGGLVRVHYNSGPVYRPYYRPYRPYYGDRYYYSRPHNNIVSDAQTGITTSEQPSLFGRSRLGEKNLEISQQARQAPPPTLEDMETQVARIKAMGAEKERRALEERAKTLELELKIAKLEKELAKVKKED